MLDACNAVSSRDGAIADEVKKNRNRHDHAEIFPRAVRVVRAFNTMSYMVFAREANRPDPKLAIPIAGDDQQALQVAAALVRDAGFDPYRWGTSPTPDVSSAVNPAMGSRVTAVELEQKLSLP